MRADVVPTEYAENSIIPRVPELDTRIDPQLVLRRPDLQVAELLTRAQSARIGLTEADLYPQFFLFGSVGLSQTVRTSKSFDTSDALTATIGPGLSWNIFNMIASRTGSVSRTPCSRRA